MRRTTLLTLMISAAAVSTVSAQKGALVSVGAEAVLNDPAGGLGHSLRLVPLVRVRLKPGLWPALAIGGFQVRRGEAEGQMKVRTLMAGPTYGLERGRLSASVSMLAGYAFSRLEAAPQGQRLRGAMAFQPSAGLWYDLSESVGLHASVGYLVARPSLAVDGPDGPRITRIRADALVLRVGVVYAVF